MSLDRFGGDLVVQGNLTAVGGFNPPNNCIRDANVATPSAPASAINDAKLIHRLAAHYQQAPGANIAAATTDVHIVNGTSGTLVNIWLALTGQIPSGGTQAATIDVQRSTSGGAFATVLSSTVTLGASNTIRTAVQATIAGTALVQGDILRVVVTVSGTGGTAPQGLIVTIDLAETPS